MIKGAIFDVDGTLLNSMPVWENLGELYLKSVGVEAEPGLGEELSAMSLPQGADYLIQHYHLGKTRNKVLDGINQQVRDFYAQKVPLKPGVRDFLEGLREYRIPMVIVTSSDRGNVEAALKRLGVMNFFDGMLTCTEMGTDKNRPDIYLAASLQLDTEPGCLPRRPDRKKIRLPDGGRIRRGQRRETWQDLEYGGHLSVRICGL